MNTPTMYKTRLALVASVLLTLLLHSCSKKDDAATPSNPVTPNPLPNCDVVGYEYNGSHYIAKYWKNGVETRLSNGMEDVKANAISVSGNDVFIAGDYNDPNTYYNLPKLWKNGTEIPMNVIYPGAGLENKCRGYALDVATYNGSAYVAGYVSDGGGSTSIAVLWVNGGSPLLLCPRMDQDLNNGSSFARSVFVTPEGDVYVAGEQYIGGGLGNKQIVMWKNGIKSQITNHTADVNGFPGYVTSIHVSGSDVYIGCTYTPEIGGQLIQRVAYFKNRELILVSDPSTSHFETSLFVANNSVYISGNSGNPSPSIWKNNQETLLPTIKYGATINRVFVKNNDVYGCGESDLKSKAVVWKNNTIYALTDGQKTNIATDIFIR